MSEERMRDMVMGDETSKFSTRFPIWLIHRCELESAEGEMICRVLNTQCWKQLRYRYFIPPIRRDM